MSFQLLGSHETEYLLTTDNNSLWLYLFWHNFVDTWGFVHPANCWMLLIGLYASKIKTTALAYSSFKYIFCRRAGINVKNTFWKFLFRFLRKKAGTKSDVLKQWQILGFFVILCPFDTRVSSKGLSTLIIKVVETNTFLRRQLNWIERCRNDLLLKR